MRVDRRQLRPHRADAQASNRAWHLAEQWRAAGLAVEEKVGHYRLRYRLYERLRL